jgi:hypothetical protein
LDGAKFFGQKHRLAKVFHIRVFEKPGRILHSTRCPLDTLEKAKGRRRRSLQN